MSQNLNGVSQEWRFGNSCKNVIQENDLIDKLDRTLKGCRVCQRTSCLYLYLPVRDSGDLIITYIWNKLDDKESKSINGGCFYSDLVISKLLSRIYQNLICYVYISLSSNALLSQSTWNMKSSICWKEGSR